MKCKREFIINIGSGKLYQTHGFSAHADRDGMIEWMKYIKGLKKVFLVHGEVNSQNAFKETIKTKLQIDAHIVSFKEEITL